MGAEPAFLGRFDLHNHAVLDMDDDVAVLDTPDRLGDNLLDVRRARTRGGRAIYFLRAHIKHLCGHNDSDATSGY